MSWLKILLIVSFFVYIFSLSFTTSTDLNQDLGRHIKIGEIISQTRSVPKTNFFSYTTPNFPFVNHHWLFELITYHLSLVFGLNSLIFLKVILMLLSVGIVIRVGIKQSGVIPTILSALLFSPLLLERNDIRPELFGYLFFATLLYFLLNEQLLTERSETVPYNTFFNKSRLTTYRLSLIPIIMLLWINTHITFVFGVFISISFFIKNVLLSLRGVERRSNPTVFSNNQNNEIASLQKSSFAMTVKTLSSLTLLTLIALLLNPNGLDGLLYPLRIFGNYGYTIVENQNIFLLNSITFNPLIKYFFFLSPLVIVSLFILLFKKKYIEALLTTTYLLLATYQIRHLPFFVLVAIPTMSISLSVILNFVRNLTPKTFNIERSTLQKILLIILSSICIILSLTFVNSTYFRTFDSNKHFGLGYNIDGQKAAEFMLSHNLPPNMFNNFDIGGYAIYRLYPQYKVFVDNRPEAYPKDFLQNIYIKMQDEPKLRDQVFKKYNINTIFFAHTDQTPWAQHFVTDILQDKNWKLIYFDTSMMIMSHDCDRTQCKDIRNDTEYIQSLIRGEKNYLQLLKLARFIDRFEKSDLTNLALQQAQNLNQSSCALKRIMINQYSNSPQFDMAEKMKQESWWCF